MKKQFLALSMAVVLFAACSKSKDEPKEISCQLVESSVTLGDETITHKYGFNTDGLITIVNESNVYGTNPPSTSTFNLAYTSNTVTIGEDVYTLDAQRRVASAVINEVDDYGNDITATYKYTYNSDGYLIKKHSDDSDITEDYTWTSGNLTGIKTTFSDGTFETTSYEYGAAERPNNFYSTMPDIPLAYHYMFKFMGKQTKNLIVREDDGTQFSYAFDDNGNITTMTDDGVNTFKYTCK